MKTKSTDERGHTLLQLVLAFTVTLMAVGAVLAAFSLSRHPSGNAANYHPTALATPAIPGRTPAAASTVTATQVAAKLVPLGCAAHPAEADTINLDQIKPKTSLACTINGENVTIDEYANAEQVSQTAQLAKTMGCSIAKQFGVTDAYYVTMSDLMVSADTAATSQQIRNTLGGGAQLRAIHCA